jgi:phosphonate transport system substrate-binding protein
MSPSTERLKWPLQAAILCAATLSLSATPNTGLADEVGRHLYFGIVPQQSATRLAKIWVPFMAALSERSGMTIDFATTKDIPTFEACLARGAYELAYMNPYHYTVFHDASGYRAFARQAEKRLQGLMVVRADSPVRGLGDLAGKELAFPSPAAFGASMLPRAEMRRSGILHKPHYVKSHDSVYRSVAAGLFPAGGGVKRTFAAIDANLRRQLRVVHETAKYTPHAFASAPGVDDAVRKRIVNAMSAIATEQPALVKALGMGGFLASQDADWDDVRALNLSAQDIKIEEVEKTTCRSD